MIKTNTNDNTNNDTYTNTNQSKDKGNQKTDKTDKDLICKYCSRQFKRRSPKVKHEGTQACIPKHKRTLCSICNITFVTVSEYKKHLTSPEHIKSLLTSDNNEPVIIKQKTVTALDIDPMLSQQDREQITSTTGSGITMKFEDDAGNIHRAKLNLQKETELEKEIANEKEEREYLNEIADRNNPHAMGYTSYQDLIQQEIFNRPMPTETQEEILCQLVDANDDLSDDKRQLFLSILKAMSVEDADFMTTYIRDCGGLDMESKQIYLELIDKFIMKLTQIYNKGYKQIGGKDIMTFISRLSK
jgi:hypothetical protein